MPRHVTEFTVLISSPNDLQADRDAVEEVIDELNELLRSRSIRLRAWRWEKSATPGIGDEGQDVVRRSYRIDEFDLVIGLLGAKLGTPTSGAPSGTVSEIREAIAMDGRRFDNFHVQVYFKNESLNVHQIDVSEISRLQEFKQELVRDGVLFKLYGTEKELMASVRLGLNRAIECWLKNNPGFIAKSDAPVSSESEAIDESNLPEKNSPLTVAEEDDDELGIIDYIADFESNLADVLSSMTSISTVQTEITNSVNAMTARAPSFATMASHDQKKVINALAAELNGSAEKIFAALENASNKFQQALHSNRRAIKMFFEDNQNIGKDRALSEIDKVTASLLGTLENNEHSLDGLYAAINSTPRLTKEFNIAKRKLLAATLKTKDFHLETAREVRSFREDLNKL